MESSFSNSTMHPSISLASPDKIAAMQSSTILAAAISFTFFFQNTSGAACSSFLLSFCTFLSDSICNKQDSSISSSPSAIAPKHWSKIRSALNRSFCSSQSIESFFVALNVVVDVVVLIIGLLPNLRIDEEVWVVVVVVVATSNKTRWWWQQIIFSFNVISLLSADNRVVYYFWRRKKERERSFGKERWRQTDIFWLIVTGFFDLWCEQNFLRPWCCSFIIIKRWNFWGREETEKKNCERTTRNVINVCVIVIRRTQCFGGGRRKKKKNNNNQKRRKSVARVQRRKNREISAWENSARRTRDARN